MKKQFLVFFSLVVSASLFAESAVNQNFLGNFRTFLNDETVSIQASKFDQASKSDFAKIMQKLSEYEDFGRACSDEFKIFAKYSEQFSDLNFRSIRDFSVNFLNDVAELRLAYFLKEIDKPKFQKQTNCLELKFLDLCYRKTLYEVFKNFQNVVPLAEFKPVEKVKQLSKNFIPKISIKKSGDLFDVWGFTHSDFKKRLQLILKNFDFVGVTEVIVEIQDSLVDSKKLVDEERFEIIKFPIKVHDKGAVFSEQDQSTIIHGVVAEIVKRALLKFVFRISGVVDYQGGVVFLERHFLNASGKTMVKDVDVFLKLAEKILGKKNSEEICAPDYENYLEREFLEIKSFVNIPMSAEVSQKILKYIFELDSSLTEESLVGQTTYLFRKLNNFIPTQDSPDVFFNDMVRNFLDQWLTHPGYFLFSHAFLGKEILFTRLKFVIGENNSEFLIPHRKLWEMIRYEKTVEDADGVVRQEIGNRSGLMVALALLDQALILNKVANCRDREESFPIEELGVVFSKNESDLQNLRKDVDENKFLKMLTNQLFEAEKRMLKNKAHESKNFLGINFFPELEKCLNALPLAVKLGKVLLAESKLFESFSGLAVSPLLKELIEKTYSRNQAYIDKVLMMIRQGSLKPSFKHKFAIELLSKKTFSSNIESEIEDILTYQKMFEHVADFSVTASPAEILKFRNACQKIKINVGPNDVFVKRKPLAFQEVVKELFDYFKSQKKGDWKSFLSSLGVVFLQ